MPAATFELVPRGRIVGLAFGAMHSVRRGAGSDVAGSRTYVPGDDVKAINWGASARLSAARGSDEFVLRERYAEEAPRVVVVCDRRPEMQLFPRGFPWLRKVEAQRAAIELIRESTVEAHGFSAFYPWHRAYLLDLERELQNIDPSVSLPYWRFDQPAPGLFTPAEHAHCRGLSLSRLPAARPALE